MCAETYSPALHLNCVMSAWLLNSAVLAVAVFFLLCFLIAFIIALRYYKDNAKVGKMPDNAKRLRLFLFICGGALIKRHFTALVIPRLSLILQIIKCYRVAVCAACAVYRYSYVVYVVALGFV